MADVVALTAPARPESVRVARQVVARVAADLEFPYDEVDDLRLAVDEACAYLLSLDPPGSTLGVRITTSRGRLEVVASTNARLEGWPPAETPESLAWQILSALVDEAAFETDAAGPAIRLRKRRPDRKA